MSAATDAAKDHLTRTTWSSLILGGLAALGIIALVGIIFGGVFGSSSASPTCDRIAPQIVDLSEDRLLTILKLSNVETVSTTPTLVQCRADARWSNNSQQPVTFHWERDAVGDAFIGYRMQP